MDPNQIVTKLELRRVLLDCDTVLDVGCGPNSTLSWFGFRRLTGIEAYAPSIETAKANATHNDLVQGDIRELERFFKPGQFDACVAVDVIEHLPKEEGLRLVRAMEHIARTKNVLTTPSGFLPQGHTENNDLQEHVSGWEAEEMRDMGYRVIGLLGPKKLRGEYHVLKWRPKILWGMVSLGLHFLWTRWQPAAAASILCVKRLR